MEFSNTLSPQMGLLDRIMSFKGMNVYFVIKQVCNLKIPHTGDYWTSQSVQIIAPIPRRTKKNRRKKGFFYLLKTKKNQEIPKNSKKAQEN